MPSIPLNALPESAALPSGPATCGPADKGATTGKRTPITGTGGKSNKDPRGVAPEPESSQALFDHQPNKITQGIGIELHPLAVGFGIDRCLLPLVQCFLVGPLVGVAQFNRF